MLRIWDGYEIQINSWNGKGEEHTFSAQAHLCVFDYLCAVMIMHLLLAVL